MTKFLVLKCVDGPVPDEIRLNGSELSVERVDDDVVVVEVPGDELVELEIGPEGEALLVEPGLARRLAADSAAEATPLLLSGVHSISPSTWPISDVHVRQPSTFVSRVDEGHAKRLSDDAVVAGTPGGTGIPVNYVGEKLTASYLSTKEPLSNEAFLFGDLRQFDTYWEPLGWALDEWIGTFSLAPFEDTVESSINVASRGDTQTGGVWGGFESLRADAASAASTTEAMRTASSASVASRGWGIGVGGPADAASTNPLVALARGLVGTFQFDFGTARTAVSGAINADLRTDVISRLQQATSWQRASSNQALASSATILGESRRLRAIRNLGPGKSANLALYSVVRQWLVSTVEGPRRKVVLIKAHEIDKSFDLRDVFRHRAILSEGLLEPKLSDVLDRVAAEYQPTASREAPPEPASNQTAPEPASNQTAERVTGKLVIIDPARGKDSAIEITALFDGDSGQRACSTRIKGPSEGTVDFEISLEGKPLGELSGWKFEFVNPGFLNLDLNAVITPVEVEIVISGGDLVKVAMPASIQIWPGYPKTYERGFTPPGPQDAPPGDSNELSNDARRLLDHLEANRPYYRMLIDLQMDPATRFDNLWKRNPRPPMPADMQPVGIAGVHLAFLTRDDSIFPSNTRLPIREILSTPAGGTFIEVLPGSTEITQAEKTDNWPKVALPENSTLPWPSPMELTPVETDQREEPPRAVELSEPPAKPETVIATKFADAMKTLEALKSTIEALKAEWPKPPKDDGDKSESEQKDDGDGDDSTQ
jgi:hypothetical protein